MTTAQYPNRDALQQGLNVYREEMSEFIARCLRQKQGSTLVASISRSLTDRQAQDFEDKLQENDGKVEASIEIGFVPRLVEQNWTETFQREFRGSRTIRNTLRVIRDLRNELAHDSTGEELRPTKRKLAFTTSAKPWPASTGRNQQEAVLQFETEFGQGERRANAAVGAYSDATIIGRQRARSQTMARRNDAQSRRGGRFLRGSRVRRQLATSL